VRPTTSHYVYSTTSAEAEAALECGPGALAYLVTQGLLAARVRTRPFPEWANVQFDTASVWALKDLPGELARARAAAPLYRTGEVARASALGSLLATLKLV